MKWTKIKPGHYVSGIYTIRRARWRSSNDGWMMFTEDHSWHDSSRLLTSAKKRCEIHAVSKRTEST